MAWRKLEDTFCDSPKIRRLARHLEVSRATASGHMALLWSWALRHAPDGDITKYHDDEIEDAVGWEGPRGGFVAACVTVRLIDDALLHDRVNTAQDSFHGATMVLHDRVKVSDSGTKRVIHNWISRGGTYAETKKKQRNRERLKMRPPDVPECPGTSPDVPECPPLEEKRREEIHTGDSVESASQNSAGCLQLTIPDGTEGLDPRRARDDVQEIWQHYRSHHPGAAKVLRAGRKEYGLIRARLQDYTADELKQAIDGYHRDPWHRGENDRGKPFLALTLILRDASHVQQGLEFTPAKANGSRKLLASDLENDQ